MSVAEDRFVDIRVQPAHIFQLRVMLESYEGLGYMTTISPDSTIVRLHFLSDQEREILSLLSYWQSENLAEIVAKGSSKPPADKDTGTRLINDRCDRLAGDLDERGDRT